MRPPNPHIGDPAVCPGAMRLVAKMHLKKAGAIPTVQRWGHKWFVLEILGIELQFPVTSHKKKITNCKKTMMRKTAKMMRMVAKCCEWYILIETLRNLSSPWLNQKKLWLFRMDFSEFGQSCEMHWYCEMHKMMRNASLVLLMAPGSFSEGFHKP